jgi:hypothetical protein
LLIYYLLKANIFLFFYLFRNVFLLLNKIYLKNRNSFVDVRFVVQIWIKPYLNFRQIRFSKTKFFLFRSSWKIVSYVKEKRGKWFVSRTAIVIIKLIIYIKIDKK